MAMSPTRYDQKAVRNYIVYLLFNYGGKYRMPKKAVNPFKMCYDPELDTSLELDPDTAYYYLTIIGILRWIIEIGRTEIITKVTLLSSHTALPREAHLEAAEQVMAHVGQ